ncbi:hypothetical protein RND61_24985 [Streptomyces sp. TRM76323]|uniref:Uncharacterized protein n=1 Tax=Streptomyces tamarix TaxID=3078565 RepID=A0ABU3QRF8_9ACTN|nr:hypothetical protein [Streptomyces tamarix]MDT9685292.1 hypothetical protein [Streptomyces tamarix]
MQAESPGTGGAFASTPPVPRDHRGPFTSPYQDVPLTGARGGPPSPVRATSHRPAVRGVPYGPHRPAAPPGRAETVHCHHPRRRVHGHRVDPRAGFPAFGRRGAAEPGGKPGAEPDGGTRRALPAPGGHGLTRSGRDAAAPAPTGTRGRGPLPEYGTCRKTEEALWQ